MRSKVQLCVNSLAPSTAQYSLPSISAISSCSPGEPQAERTSVSAATLNVRINMCFGLRSRMRHRTLIGRTDVLGIAPECSRLIIIGAWRPCSTPVRSEEHTSELQSLMRISYAVFCLKKKKKLTKIHYITTMSYERHIIIAITHTINRHVKYT